MKKTICFLLTIFILSCSYGQDSTYNQFIELINKVQNDKSLTGTFIYKGHTANIGEYKEMKTAIGKFIQITWMEHNTATPDYTAIFHNTMGYMTKNLFGVYKRALPDSKVEKNKYCKNDFCYVLRDDIKKPYIVMYKRTEAEIPVIK